MADYIELAKAVAWPIAIFFAFLFALIITWILASRQQGFRLRIPKLVDFSSEAPTLSAPPVEEKEAADPGQDQPREPETQLPVSEPDADGPQREHFMLTKDPSRLEPLYKEYVASAELSPEDLHFWSAYYVERQTELGLVDEVTALEDLAEREGKNIWPLLYLVRRCKRFGDLLGAERNLERAKDRVTPKTKKWYFIEGINLYWDLVGRERAYSYFKEALIPPLADQDLAEMLEVLANREEDEKDPFSNSPLVELELAFDPKRNSRRFALAYRYMDTAETKFLAYRHFRLLELEGHAKEAVLNNLGVVSGAISSSAQITMYEKSAAEGNPTALGNIANALIRAGFLNRAKDLLASTADQETTTVVSAREALVKAQNELEESLEKYRHRVAASSDRYRATVIRAFEYFRSSKNLASSAAFVSEDKSVSVTVDEQQAVVNWSGTAGIWKGVLRRKSIYFQGTVTRTTSGAGALSLLGSSTRTVAVLQTDEDQAILLSFESSATEPDFAIRSLFRVEQEEVQVLSS